MLDTITLCRYFTQFFFCVSTKGSLLFIVFFVSFIFLDSQFTSLPYKAFCNFAKKNHVYLPTWDQLRSCVEYWFRLDPCGHLLHGPPFPLYIILFSPIMAKFYTGRYWCNLRTFWRFRDNNSITRRKPESRLFIFCLASFDTV